MTAKVKERSVQASSADNNIVSETGSVRTLFREFASRLRCPRRGSRLPLAGSTTLEWRGQSRLTSRESAQTAGTRSAEAL